MQRLEPLDASFVYFDSPPTPMHVALTCVLDPSTAPDGYSFARMRQVIIERLHLLPPFRRRLVEVPGHLHRPMWAEDPGFDVDQHLHRTVLSAPGTLDNLEVLTAELLARPLDRSRPLWEMHVVEGLEDGMVATVTKVHHAAIDGVSGAELLANLLDLGPEPTETIPPESPWTPETVPSAVARVGGALGELVRQPIVATQALAHTVAAAMRVARQGRLPDMRTPPLPFNAPRTCLEAPLTERRNVGFAHIDLDDINHIKKAVGVTINDVVLALCAGALRSYLDERGDHPDRSLVAAVPVSLRTEDERGTMGNRLSGMLVDLATTIDDPLARLQAIAQSAHAAKQQTRALGPDAISNLAGLASPLLLTAMSALASRIPLLALRPVCNVVVSNFPGPPLPLYFAGARLVAAYPMGPLAAGAALNITVQSYGDSLWFGVVACPDAVREPWTLTDRLIRARHELTKAAD